MNIYRKSFTAACPNNGFIIAYFLEIQHRNVLMVEDINDATMERSSSYHEAIADELWERFGGVQVLKAHHHGVDIETIRGAK